jgi:hypothetical protein
MCGSSNRPAQPFHVDQYAQIPSDLLVEAQFVRFECRAQTEISESPLILWINLDQEVSPDQESIGVYLGEQDDLPKLEEEISTIVVRTAIERQTRLALQSDLEKEVREVLTHLASDLQEAAKLASP